MNSLHSLLETYVESHPEEAARSVETLDREELAEVIGSLPLGAAVVLVEHLNPHAAGPALESIDSGRAVDLVRALSPRPGALLLQHMSEGARSQILQALPSRLSLQLQELLQYSLETAGGMMDPRVASLRIDLTAEQAIETLRKTPRDVLYYLYVTDRKGRLVGVLNMRDLLLANAKARIEPLVRRKVLAVPATMDREEVVSQMREHGFLAVPVVDFENKLVGVVKHAEALEAGQLEAFEDLQLMVGVGVDERALSPVSTVIKRRLPWLFVNLLTAFVAATVVGLFEGIIAQVTALAVLLPVVAGQGGNSGAQSLTIVTRGLALREVVSGFTRRLILKELIAGLINGTAVALVTALAVYFWQPLDSTSKNIALAAVIGLSMVISMAVASVAGTAIPLALKRLGQDPAQSASIFLTTVTDVVGFASFLGLAVLFSALLM